MVGNGRSLSHPRYPQPPHGLRFIPKMIRVMMPHGLLSWLCRSSIPYRSTDHFSFQNLSTNWILGQHSLVTQIPFSSSTHQSTRSSFLRDRIVRYTGAIGPKQSHMAFPNGAEGGHYVMLETRLLGYLSLYSDSSPSLAAREHGCHIMHTASNVDQ